MLRTCPSARSSWRFRQNVRGQPLCPNLVWLSDHKSISRPDGDRRMNPLGIQMLPKSLHEQIFVNSSHNSKSLSKTNLEKAENHLKSHKITSSSRSTTTELPDVSLVLPKLHGSLQEHFNHIAQEQVKPYKELAEKLLNVCPLEMPKEWSFSPGWTKYTLDSTCQVPYPEEDVFVLDVEVCVKESDRPVLATAVSPTSWYSWVSERLTTSDDDYFAAHGFDYKHYCKLGELIPLQSQCLPSQSNSKLVVGHSVSYDRARIMEEYAINVRLDNCCYPLLFYMLFVLLRVQIQNS